MEDGLHDFYLRLSRMTEDREAAELYLRLAEVEDLHKDRLFGLYLSLRPETVDRETFDAEISNAFIESGLTAEQFLQAYSGRLEPLTQALELGLAVEAQALDLYLRFAREVEDSEIRLLIHQLAQDEKTHLARLEELLGRKV